MKRENYRRKGERWEAYWKRIGYGLCVDCSFDTRDELYMVHDELWAAAGLDKNGGRLCVNCIEGRLGRRLTAADFQDLPANDDRYTRHSPRLRARLADS